jgi:pSer/pThr/pTyr-binding forkhead associated (FHA) protein
MTVTCPKGHTSTEDDFCSECGAKIAPASGNETAISNTAADQLCPDCNAPRLDGGRFCELCGYNFETGAHGEIPVTPAAPAPVPPPAAPSLVADIPPAPAKWTVFITADPALKQEDSPDPPADWTPRTIAASTETLLIGRKSQSRGIFPDILLDFDSAVSHRHAVLTRNGENWTIRDLGSSNGTRLNGKDIEPMTDVPVSAGDQITLGHWTRLTLEREGKTPTESNRPDSVS